MSLVRRHITVRFQLGTGSFGETGSDTIEITGLRASASIVKAGGVSMSQLDLRVFGMSLDVMNKLTILGKPLVDGRNNKVTVMAGDEEAGMAVVFVGTISEAWIDTRNVPEVSFIVTAFTGIIDALTPIPATSFTGSVDVALVVSGLAQQGGYAFENSGVTAQIANPYLAGTMLDQLQQVARAGNFNCIIDDETIAIWPAGGARDALVPLLSPETGLIGYPMRTENGISLATLFNPSITFGAQVQVESALTPANGGWTVFSVTHDLESETVNGKWFTRMECSILGQAVAVAA